MLAEHVVGDLVRDSFGLPVTAVELVRSLVNDVYAIQTPDARYALKLYRPVDAPRAWSVAEIGWEQELVVELLRSGLVVPAPVPLVDGELVGELVTPEGVRPYALTGWLPGAKPQPPWTDDLYRTFGALTARFHSAAGGWGSWMARRPVDPVEDLMDTTAEVVTALPEPADQALVDRAAHWAHAQLGRLVTQGMTWGIRHGDVTLDNALVSGTMLSLHDFDRSGPGWLAADLTGVRATEHWAAFEAGYAGSRTLSAADLRAMPALEVVALVANLRFHLVEKPRLFRTDPQAARSESLSDEGGWIERELTRLRALGRS